MGFLHHKEKNVCDQCGEKFATHEDLINHARHIHHHAIVRCKECGKEFVHEKDVGPGDVEGFGGVGGSGNGPYGTVSLEFDF